MKSKIIFFLFFSLLSLNLFADESDGPSLRDVWLEEFDTLSRSSSTTSSFEVHESLSRLKSQIERYRETDREQVIMSFLNGESMFSTFFFNRYEMTDPGRPRRTIQKKPEFPYYFDHALFNGLNYRLGRDLPYNHPLRFYDSGFIWGGPENLADLESEASWLLRTLAQHVSIKRTACQLGVEFSTLNPEYSYISPFLTEKLEDLLGRSQTFVANFRQAAEANQERLAGKIGDLDIDVESKGKLIVGLEQLMEYREAFTGIVEFELTSLTSKAEDFFVELNSPCNTHAENPEIDTSSREEESAPTPGFRRSSDVPSIEAAGV